MGRACEANWINQDDLEYPRQLNSDGYGIMTVTGRSRNLPEQPKCIELDGIGVEDGGWRSCGSQQNKRWYFIHVLNMRYFKIKGYFFNTPELTHIKIMLTKEQNCSQLH